MDTYKQILERLARERRVSHSEMVRLVVGADEERLSWASGLAREIRSEHFGSGVFLRALLEISNCCRGGCYYCGLRAENDHLRRYTLSTEEIVEVCREGYGLGFRSFVLQSGEVLGRAEEVAEVVRRVKSEMPEVAVTLSLGEQSAEVYKPWRRAGADRYLLRHESATQSHYEALHPKRMSFEGRQECLSVLRHLGYQVGAGFMVGSPYQGAEELAREVEYVGEWQPEMVGIGPFIPQSHTPFADFKRGSVELTLLMVALTRIVLPKALIPATTALASADERGTLRGLGAGANVVMPNLTPAEVRAAYAIYDGKKISREESAEGLDLLCEMLQGGGYQPLLTRGDHPDFRID